MDVTYIILLYWIIAICATYVIRHYNGKRRTINPFDNHEDKKKRIKTHLQIWFLMPIAIPFFLIYLTIHSIYVVINKHRYRNRPKPLSEASLSDEVKEQLKEDSNKYSNKVTDWTVIKSSSKQITERMSSFSKEEATKNCGNLSLIADNYIKFVTSLDIKSMDSLNPFLRKLPNLSLDENYVLDDFRPREQTNSVLWLYARQKDLPRPSDADFKYLENNFFHVFGGNSNRCRVERQIKVGNVPVFAYKKRIKPLEPFHYITLPFTEEAIWQAYLLASTYHLIGMRWHGIYEARTFIFAFGDIDHIDYRYAVAKEQIRAIWSPQLAPSVVLCDGYAYVIHCWFNAWKGFEQIKCRVEYDLQESRVTNFRVEETKTLMKYHCGICL